jgi:hypothetical protein
MQTRSANFAKYIIRAIFVLGLVVVGIVAFFG